MILIVNTTSDTTVTKEIRERAALIGFEPEVIEASGLHISHCIGCNYCWLKTPGVCSVKDDYEIILKKIIHADQLWVVSDTALGFLDHKGKNIFDRILPIATMYLKFGGDQMRHVPRYDKRTDIGIIYRGEPDKEYLQRWSERAALNFESRSLGVYGTDKLKEAVSCMC
ncbi:MAG: flavodoxin family protein [Lachnospiraceae bacterium]|nr:flavodoxin family protein [Lachnospiraceae bacterium]